MITKFLKSKIFEIGVVVAVIGFLLLLNGVFRAVYNPAPPRIKTTPTAPIATISPLLHGAAGRPAATESGETPPLPAGCTPDFVIPTARRLYNGALELGLIDQDYAAIVGVLDEQWVIIDGTVMVQLTLRTGAVINIVVFAMCEQSDGTWFPLIDAVLVVPE
ncbi:hypothetical protein LCGC14_2862890 [marine sediment metagenome]|uniref:Uncharacterized protein n=1 Tax=marine sediment metagenome TaxID=412755 RepID=A0A0F9AWB2_9ZZZZ